MLTADGSGGASWQNAGGGTTLTQYTYEVATTPTQAQRARLLSIITQAKGNVQGYVEITNSNTPNYAVAVNVNEIELEPGLPNYYLIYTFGYSINEDYAVFYKVVMTASGSFDGRKGHAVKLADNTITNITSSHIGIGKINIQYYNDTEILS